MPRLNSVVTDAVGFVALLGLILAALLPIFLGVGVTALAFPDAVQDATSARTWGYVLLAAALWLPMTGVAMMVPRALARTAGTDRDALALQIVEALLSWAVLGWLLDLLVLETWSTALLAAALASGGYLLARPWVEGPDETRDET